jgi:MFS family permease
VSNVGPPDLRAPRGLLAMAAVAVGFAAADTYVVVLALPDMMASVGLGIDQLQRGAPVVSGFLLGYVAMLPLIGRIADLRGRLPVLVGSLVVFSVGSLVTAGSYDLVTMVTGRFLQGVGAGGLVPATLALVADIWTAEHRGPAIGVVAAVQELGSVIGPLYGALIIAVWSWRAIFWLNLVVGTALAVVMLSMGRGGRRRHTSGSRFDLPGTLLALAGLTALALVLTEPNRLASGLTTGRAFIRYAGDSRWSTPMAMAWFALAALFVVREATAHYPLLGWRRWGAVARAADVTGAALLGISLAGVVLAFASADPAVQVLSPAGGWLLVASGLAGIGFVMRQRSARAPLLPAGALRVRPAWGALVVNVMVGAALIAALVDIPVFARVTVYPDSQLDAALVLVRLLVAIPVGALAGGYLTRRLPNGMLAAAGMAMAAGAFVLMTRWQADTLHQASPTLTLVLCGLGFGLAIAPTNAALLSATHDTVHGLASALLVVARMLGMLVGISTLTAIGLHRFYAVSASLPSLHEACPANDLCDAYVDALKHAGIAQMHAIFWGAAVAATAAALLSLLLLSHPPPASRSSAGSPG